MSSTYVRKRKKTKIKVRKIEEGNVSYIAEKLQQNHHKLKEVQLNSRNLNSEDIKSLANAVKGNNKLRKLYLNKCGLKDDSVPHLVNFIQESKLYILEMEQNDFQRKGVESLTSAVLNNTTICVLKLSGLNSTQHVKLRRHLKNNKLTLKRKKVQTSGRDEENKKIEEEKERKRKEAERKIEEEKERKRQEAERKRKEAEKKRKEEEKKRKEEERKRKEKKRKEEGKKKEGKIKPSSRVMYVINKLRNNSIAEVSLGKQQITDSDVKLLCDTLKKNTRVKKLDLQDNKITDKGIDYVISLLKVNACIETIELEGNNLGAGSVQKMLKGIKNNISLTDLTISEFATDEELDDIDDILDRNFDRKEEENELKEKKKKEIEEKKKKEEEKKMAEAQRKKAEEKRRNEAKQKKQLMASQPKPGRRKSILLTKAAKFGYKPKKKAKFSIKNLISKQKKKQPPRKLSRKASRGTNPFLKQIQKEKATKKFGVGSGKLHHLLRWANIVGYDYDIEVRNFTSSWKDGKMFSAIVNYHDEDLMTFPEEGDSRTPQELVEEAFDCLEEMGVEPVLDPLDAGLEKKSMMLYLSLMRDQMKKKYS